MFKSLKQKLISNRNIFTLITGSVVAQLIVVLILPILTRLWSPDEFGFFASFIAAVSILEVLYMGRFDLALMLPKKNEDALHLLYIGFFLSLIFALFSYLLLIIETICRFFPYQIIQNWFFLIPLSAVIFSVYSLMLGWNNRLKKYRIMSSNRVLQSIFISSSQVFMGFLYKISLGLIYSDIIGRVISLIFIFKNSNFLEQKIKFNFKKKITLFKRYKKFLLILAPSSLINVLANQLPFLILPLIFSLKITGMYFLVFKLLMSPISLIGTPILEIFKNKIQDASNKNEKIKTIFIETLKKIFLVGFGPALIFIIIAPKLFLFLFGQEWVDAGHYAQILTPLAFIKFISSPLSYILIFMEKHSLIFKLQMLFLILNSISLYLSSFYLSIELVLWSLTLSGIMFYTLLIIFSYLALDEK